MEDQKHLPVNDASVNKPRKKKPPPQNPETFQSPVDSIQRSHDVRTLPNQKVQKGSKRNLTNEVSPLFQPDSSSSGNEYRALRRKYLLLEEESFGIGSELKTVEDDIKALEEEKLSLLDELVVLEGLIDPMDISPQGQRLA